ncbi:nicotinate phosphoribosyltransferase-like [Onthophagus taurus]|uniref:nicotinate phosphoribosyltransferase-like n=1 Tax=Onthophagus taurus TaxID=166361 RepID=UPI000C20B665|nr:nicotinate phosphoribosyltransferase-like [Onthophagus taurus]
MTTNNPIKIGDHSTKNTIVQPLLTDLYQITMAYAYWKSGKHRDVAVFDLYFRKNPFHGEFTIFAGLGDAISFVKDFRYSQSDLKYLKSALPETIEKEFFEYLSGINANDVVIYGLEEGSVCFPRVPLLIVEGPLIVVQLLETTLLTLINFASLVATNAARHRIVAGDKILLEFGLRRAQGPDGGLTASKYAYIGGFDGTSNVLAGKLFNIPVKGTHAHAYITSFTDLKDVKNPYLTSINGEKMNLLGLSLGYRSKLVSVYKVLEAEASNGELAAFVSYAQAFPNNFVALIDTYDVKRSGLINFSAVALGLNDLGYQAVGVRIDSGDLAYLSRVARQSFVDISKKFNLTFFESLMIIVSNDLNDDTILSLNEQGHNIDCFAIGTHLVTCQKQPAMGGIYKLVELNNQPRMKLTQDVGKITIPGRKSAYRLFSAKGDALIDLLQNADEAPPSVNERVLCRHPFEESKRAYVIPSRVENLHSVYWENGKVVGKLQSLEEIRKKVQASLKTLRCDIKRNLNPTPYKVSVSDALYTYLHQLWMENAPIGELM